MSVDVTVNKLRRNFDGSDFSVAYKKLILGLTDEISEKEIIFLLKLSVIFLNLGDEGAKKLGYRIILRYSNLFNDYKPLFDAAINLGFIPVSKFAEEQLIEDKGVTLIRGFMSVYQDFYKQEEIYLSKGQKKLSEFSSTCESNFVLVAPTSYGKSDLIIRKIEDCTGARICVIVPTKALLAQTKRRIINRLSESIPRVITHPDMYQIGEESFIAVLTQERLLRLLKRDSELKLDYLLIDEAHNLFAGDGRSILLSQVIMMVKHRNDAAVINYYTPFLVDHTNLVIPYKPFSLKCEKSGEYIKVERFFYIDLMEPTAQKYLYDQFLNETVLYSDDIYITEIEYILSNSSSKNIIYLNRPRDIQFFAMSIISQLKDIDCGLISDAIAAISDYIHPQYDLLKCIKKGVAYHHGAMPDIVRLYVESIFTNNKQVKHLVTNSTLLEGVNIPAERLFLLTYRIGRGNLSRSQFKNLAGRICRFSEAFRSTNNDLMMLEPEIHLIKSTYSASNANVSSFLKNTANVSLSIKDKVDNVLLKPVEVDLNEKEEQTLKESIEYLENIEPNTIEGEDVYYAESEIVSFCYKNNITSINLKENAARLESNHKVYLSSFETSINDVLSLMNSIELIFIRHLDVRNRNFKRLENPAARNFYAMLLDLRMKGSSYKQMVARFLSYWKSIANPIVFVGSKWGEMSYDMGDYNDYFIDIRKKDQAQRINLAIVRIKEEMDFLDHELMKYIDTLADLELIETGFYERIRYGSSDSRIIVLMKNGFSIDLAKCLLNDIYRDFVSIDIQKGSVVLDFELLKRMKENEENELIIFECSYHVVSKKHSV